MTNGGILVNDMNKFSRGTIFYSTRIAELVLQENHKLSAQEREQMVDSIAEHYPNLSSENLKELCDRDLAKKFLEMLRDIDKKYKSSGEDE